MNDEIKAKGNQAHTPTRSEWLAMRLNAEYPNDLFSASELQGLRITFDTDYKDTIIVRCIQAENLSNFNTCKEVVDRIINDACNRVKSAAKLYRWDSWVKIEIEK